MPEDWAEAMLTGRVNASEEPERHSGVLNFRTYAMGLEAMEPCTGDRVADLYAVHPYLGVLLSQLVGKPGSVALRSPGGFLELRKMKKLVKEYKNIAVAGGGGPQGSGGDIEMVNNPMALNKPRLRSLPPAVPNRVTRPAATENPNPTPPKLPLPSTWSRG